MPRPGPHHLIVRHLAADRGRVVVNHAANAGCRDHPQRRGDAHQQPFGRFDDIGDLHQISRGRAVAGLAVHFARTSPRLSKYRYSAREQPAALAISFMLDRRRSFSLRKESPAASIWWLARPTRTASRARPSGCYRNAPTADAIE